MKPKLVIWSDFVVASGFGNVAKNLFDDMYKYFDVSVVSINYYGNKRYNTNKYFVYPTRDNDILNRSLLEKVVRSEQPEVVILFQDSFNIADVIDSVKAASPKSKIIVYFPIDAPDYSLAWQNILMVPDAIITYTDWGVSLLNTLFPKLNKKVHKLYHGVDQNTFFPLPYEDIVRLRKENNWENKFVITNVNRYQPRKAIPVSVRAFSMFAKGFKVCKCGNWYPKHRHLCDLNGCGESDVLTKYDAEKKDVHYYLHMNPQEPVMGGSRTCYLQNHLIVAGFRDHDYGKIIAINGRNIYNDEVPESTLNEIYNASNVNLTTTNGEGFGLSLIESAATGTKTIAPNNTVIPEILKGTGVLIDNSATYSHQSDNAFVRPIIDEKKLVVALNKEYEAWKEAGVEKTLDFSCIKLVKEHYDWNNIRAELLKIIRTVYPI